MRAGLRTGIVLLPCLWFGCPADSMLNGGDPLDMPNQQDLSSGADLSAPGTSSWARSFGNAADQVPTGLATDRSGNVVVVGNFAGTVDFGGSVLTSAGGNDIFVAKLDSSVSPVWSKRFGDAANQLAGGVATDSSGNLVVVGTLTGSADFGSGTLTSAGGSDIFVAKFDSNGSPVWSKSFGDAANQLASAVATDSSGNVIVVGSLAGTVNFGGGVLTSAGGNDIFVVKLDPNGNHIFSKRFGDAANQLPSGVAADSSGNVVVVGSLAGSADFGGGTLSSAGGNDIFVAKFDSNGNHIFSKRFGDAADQLPSGVAADSSGNVVFCGSFSGSVDFGGGPLTSAGGNDIFVAKFAPNGTQVWSRRFGNTGADLAYGVAVDGNSNVLLAGSFSASVDFGGGPLASAGALDMILAKFTPAGTHVWSSRYGSSLLDEAIGIGVTASGNVLATGSFQGSVAFDGVSLVSAGGQDLVILRHTP